MKKVLIIGGGAAGMMAAVAAADAGAEVCLIEKNEKLGKKIYITGKGRCNVTNAAEMETVFANCVTNAKFLYSAFYRFDNQAVMDFFEKAGCRLKTERGDRVFPVSDHASDVIFALEREMKQRGVNILLNTAVKELLFRKSDAGSQAQDVSCIQRIAGVRLTNGRILEADSVIVATGGLSYPTTGSTGDGYRFASDSGHQLVPTSPSLVPFETAEEWCKDLMGLALKNVSVELVQGKKLLFAGFGEMLFTHFGVSGPLILSASSYYMKQLERVSKKSKKSGNMSDGKPGKEDVQDISAVLAIDLKPALDLEQLDKRLIRDFEENKNKQFKNALGGLFPTRLIPVMIRLSGIDPEKKIHEVTREERRSFAQLIKKLPLTVTGVRDYNEAIITRGGVSVKDVNPSTMESKKVSGLYFAGEVLDLDALTGGFNLQIAWSTGYLAGESAGAEACAGRYASEWRKG